MHVGHRHGGLLRVGASHGDRGLGCGLEGLVQCCHVRRVHPDQREGVQLVGQMGGFACCVWFGLRVVLPGLLGVLHEWRLHRACAVVGCLGPDPV